MCENGQKQRIMAKDSSFRTNMYLPLEDIFLAMLDGEH